MAKSIVINLGNGARGLQGEKGEKGADGFSPTITTSSNGKDTILEITDINGTRSATISGSSSNYEDIDNKPMINSVELINNKTSSDLGLQPAGEYADTRITNQELENIFADM